MNSVYYIENDNLFLIKNKIIELKNKYDYELYEYDLKDTSIDDVIECLDTYNFLCNHKLVVIYNPKFLMSSNKEKDDKDISIEDEEILEEDIDFSSFEKYLDNPNKDNTLIIVSSRFDSRKKLVKKIKKNYKKINVVINSKDYIKESLKDYKLENGVVDTLCSYTNNNISAIKNEIDKIKLYKENDLNISVSDIKTIVHKIIDESVDYIYELIDNISKRNIKRSIEIYNDLTFIGVDPIRLMVLLSNQIRLIYQVKVLTNTKNDNTIAKEFNIHPYRIKLAREKGYNYSEKELISLLKKISINDLKIKKGEITPELAIELLILENA